MALELVKCPHCGYEFRIDMKALEKEGETFIIRNSKSTYSLEPEPRRIKTIDLECPNCKRTFEYEVKS